MGATPTRHPNITF